MIDWDSLSELGGGDSKKVGLCVIAEKMKICSYVHVGNILTHRIFPTGWTVSSVCIVPATDIIGINKGMEEGEWLGHV